MKKEYVILLLVVAAVAVWYFFIRKKPATQSAVIAPGQPAVLPVATKPATGGTAVDGSPTIFETATEPSQTVVLNPRSPSAPVMTFDSVNLNWINSLGVGNKNRALAMYPSMTDAEKAYLADIIVNVWGGKRPQTSADTQWWNTWRVKYHILDGTYNP